MRESSKKITLKGSQIKDCFIGLRKGQLLAVRGFSLGRHKLQILSENAFLTSRCIMFFKKRVNYVELLLLGISADSYGWWIRCWRLLYGDIWWILLRWHYERECNQAYIETFMVYLSKITSSQIVYAYEESYAYVSGTYHYWFWIYCTSVNIHVQTECGLKQEKTQNQNLKKR